MKICKYYCSKINKDHKQFIKWASIELYVYTVQMWYNIVTSKFLDTQKEEFIDIDMHIA